MRQPWRRLLGLTVLALDWTVAKLHDRVTVQVYAYSYVDGSRRRVGAWRYRWAWVAYVVAWWVNHSQIDPYDGGYLYVGVE